MELKPGYKQTEVGAIPEEWGVHAIGQCLRLVNGRAFKPEEWRQQGVPIIRIQNLNDRESAFNYCDTHVEDRHHVTIGDVLFAWSGTTGTSFGARIWDGPNGVLNQHIFKVIADEAKLIPYYSFLVLQRVQEDIEKKAHGFKASFVHVKKSDLVGVWLPVPPITEQRAIAAALNDMDALIGALDSALAKKRDLKQAAVQQLLTGQRRLPGFQGEWKVKRLGEAAEVLMGQSPPGTSYNRTGFGVPLINGPTEFTERHPIKIQWTTQPTKFCEKGDLLLCVRGSSTGRINVSDDEYCIGRGVAAIRANPAEDPQFVTFQVHSAIPKILTATTGSTFPNIDGKSLNAIQIRLPSFEEQRAIATVLTDMDAEIAALEARRDKTRALKQGMMQELLTGRIRLPVAVGEAAASAP